MQDHARLLQTANSDGKSIADTLRDIVHTAFCEQDTHAVQRQEGNKTRTELLAALAPVIDTINQQSGLLNTLSQHTQALTQAVKGGEK
jgi:hypothetical protein